MMSGRSELGGQVDYSKNIFLNFQLTPHRAKLAKAVREARATGSLERESVNPNGDIKVKVTGGGWKKISSLEELGRTVSEVRPSAARGLRNRQ